MIKYVQGPIHANNQLLQHPFQKAIFLKLHYWLYVEYFLRSFLFAGSIFLREGGWGIVKKQQ